MRINEPFCNLKECRYCSDGNCTDKNRYDSCDYARLKDLELQGRLVELPCKVGDTVYAIPNIKIVEDIVDRIEINELCRKISTKKHSWLCNFENVFVTKSEAEQALAER